MTMSLRRHDKSIMNNTVGRSMSSSECRRREVTARMWRAVEETSTAHETVQKFRRKTSKN